MDDSIIGLTHLIHSAMQMDHESNHIDFDDHSHDKIMDEAHQETKQEAK